MQGQRGFTLTELTAAILLTSLVVLTAISAEITSRQFFRQTEEQVVVQDEAKIAMEHIAINLKRGNGDITSPGFSILNGGRRLRVFIDGLTGVGNGRLGDANDGTIEYNFTGNRIVYDPNTSVGGNEEDLTEDVIVACSFAVGSAANQVDISITARHDPSRAASIENPETTLTSSIVLRAMSCF